MHDSMANRSNVQYGPYSAEQREAVRQQLLSYYSSEGGPEALDPVELHSVRHMREILFACKVQGRGGGSACRVLVEGW